MSTQITAGPVAVTPLRVAAVVLGVAALPAIYWLVWTLVSIGVGLVVIGSVAAVLTASAMSAPMLLQKWENKLLGWRKSEARNNPIEQLQNFLMQKTAQVRAYEDATKKVGAQISTMADMVQNRKSMGKDVTKQESSIAAMKAAYLQMKTRCRQYNDALTTMKDKIDDAKWQQQFATLGKEALGSVSANSGQDILNSILADESFEAARTNFNEVFADLDMEATKINDTKQLDFGGGVVLDLSNVQVPQLEHAKA